MHRGAEKGTDSACKHRRRLGNAVTSLHRQAIGPVSLDDLPIGAYRALTEAEVDSLR